jgi:hypothetical protein
MSDEESTMSEQTPEPEGTGSPDTAFTAETDDAQETTDTQVLAEEPAEVPAEVPAEETRDETREETREEITEEPAVRRGFAGGLHPVNILHLVLGVAFLGMVVNWALIESGTVETSGLRWLLPIPWVAAGAAGLIATAPRLRGR